EVFYMNNSAFCSDPKTWEKNPRILTSIKGEWEASSESIEKLLDTIKTMLSIKTDAFDEMRIKKNNIKIEIEKLSQNIDNIRQIQDKLDDYYKIIKDASDKREFFLYYIEKEAIYVKKFVKVDYKNTYCFDHMHEGIICHPKCGLEYNNQDQDTNDLRKCICLADGEHCKECGCGPERHFQSDEELKCELASNIAEELISKDRYEQATKDYRDGRSNADVCENELNELDSKVENLYERICQCCQELRNICSRFNFANELQANIDNLKKCATTIKNPKRKEKTMDFIAKLEQFIRDQSTKIL
ncbi:3861_t:CDS:2, partial [Racocetra persica]